jgi:hypothetical protein
MSENTGLIVGGGISVLICFCCIISSIVLVILYYNGVFTDEEEEKKDKDDDLPLVTPPSGIPSGTNTAQKEVFHIGGYIFTKDTAKSKCESLGAVLATDKQLQDAHAAGADWCSTGWLSDIDTRKYPIQLPRVGCNGVNGVATFDFIENADTASATPKGGANCFGIKPTIDNSGGILHFNTIGKKWSMYSTEPLAPLEISTDNRCGGQGGNKKCPTGKCCSEFGYCDTTAEHCKTNANSGFNG